VDDILKDLGQIIKKARQAAELTQDELAERVSITARYVMAIENEHKQPSLDVLCKIDRTLCISADNIFYPENEHTEREIEQLLRMIPLCNDRDQKIIISTVKTMLDTN